MGICFLKESLFAILLVNLILANPAFGRLTGMVDSNSSPQWIQREGQPLFLNGQGIHTVSIFKVKVYEISLFLEKLSNDPEEILKSSERKLISLKFLRDVDADQLRSAFSDGFYENCATQCDHLKASLDQLNSQIPDLKEGDSLELQFFPSRVILRSNRGNFAVVNAPKFGFVLLSMWLGPNPPSSTLKKMILGLNEHETK